MRKGIKYSLLVPGSIILGVVFFVVLAGLLIQTEPAKRKIADLAEKQTSRLLNGNLVIGKIEGNFFTHLILKDVFITQGTDTLAGIAEINASYNLWPLWNKTIDVYSAEIIRPQLYLEQQNDSTWNIRNLMKPGQKKETTDSDGQTTMRLKLSAFRIVEGTIRTKTLDTIIPQTVENLNTELSFYFSENEQQATLKQFSFNTIHPDFSLSQLEFSFTRNPNFMELKNFRLQTAKNLLEGEAGFEQELHTGNAQINSPALDVKEFSYFIPHLKIPVRPKININAGMTEEITRVALEMENQNQKIQLFLSSTNLVPFLFHTDETQLDYALTGKFDNVELAHWLGNPKQNYFINGEISATGRGTDPGTASVQVTGQLNNWVAKDNQPDKLFFDVSLNSGNLSGLLQGSGKFGNIKLNHSIQDVMKNPVYSAKITTRNLDLARLTGRANLSSNMNITAHIKGEEFTPEKIKAAIRMTVSNSFFQKIGLENMVASASYSNQNIQLDSLWLKTQTATLTAKGNYSFITSSNLLLATEFSGLEEFSTYLPGSNLKTRGTLTARLSGKPDSLHLESQAKLDSTQYETHLLGELTLNATVRLMPKDTIFNVQLLAAGITSGALKIDSVAAQMEGTPDSVFLTTNLTAGDFSTRLQTGVVPGRKTRVTLEDWEIAFKNKQWMLQHPPAIIEIEPLNYYVENLRLISNDMNHSLFLFAEGNISLDGEENFTLETGRLNVGDFSELFGLEEPVTGLLDIQLDLKGTADSLLLFSEFLLNDVAYNGFRIAEISGNVKHIENRVSIETLVLPGDSGKIAFSASLPLGFQPDSMAVHFNPKDSVQGLLTIRDLPLNILETLEISKNISGFLAGDINISGTVEAPLLSGNYTVNDAAFSGYGFPGFGGKFDFKNNLFSTENLIVPQDSGRLNLTATLPLRYQPDSLSIWINPKDSVSAKLLVNKISLAVLQAINPAGTIEGSLEGEINVSGPIGSPQPSGNLSLKDASVKMNEYGIDYRDVSLDLDFLRDKLEVNNFRIQSKDGNLTGTGRIDFASDFYKGNVSQSEITLKFDKFQPFNHRQFNMQVSGDAALGGKKGEVVYSGEVTIPQAEIYIPAVMRMLGKATIPEMPKPVLMQEMEKMSASGDSVNIAPPVKIKADSTRFDYLDQFNGKLRIKIPRNTWIRNEYLYVEVSGDVELIKNNDYFELFGSVDVVRGQYDMLGKTFVIDDGSIRFQGGEEMVPQMDINASYTFRNAQRVEQKLSVNIKGTANSPEVSFQLDESSVSEGDALSYILFGKSMNELTIDEHYNVAGAGGGGLAGKAAASILSSQITNFLGDKLDVDYIEVKSDGGFDNATVVVGKYLTNDLFVSYEQRFGETDEKNIAKYEVKLEYELFRFLFFELNNSSNDSGFDVILKFDAE
ncbi:translocation/assembly module TamB domain-containing protein [Mariniphaga sediminis]|uniref:translocation/assembly module TamB domain-containing protein n=1 Tax=Mariniphaga sediminis TaxID=1628158 RepID=UPI003564F35D